MELGGISLAVAAWLAATGEAAEQSAAAEKADLPEVSEQSSLTGKLVGRGLRRFTAWGARHLAVQYDILAGNGQVPTHPAMTQRGFELRSQLLGPLPIINRFLDRLGADALLERVLEADPRSRMPPAKALGVVLRNLIEQRRPLYGLGEWVAERDPSVLGLADTSARLNDDCVGRALERLFDADRAILQTEVVVNAIRRFTIDCTEFHNDSTSITFSGDYSAAKGELERGQATLKVAHGHNKDHRPDLKQLLWILTVSADGGVPVHYRVADGNTEDTQTHQETWDILRRLAGRPDFLYIADSKLCTRENMGHIDTHEGRFLTVLPRTRKEDADFRDWVQAHPPEWTLVRQGSNRDGVTDHYFMTEAPWPSAEGYRVVWVLSSGKARRDAQTRQARIVQAILTELSSQRFIEVKVAEVAEPRFRQVTRGRAGAATTYRRQDRIHVELTWQVLEDRVAYVAKSDGMFPFITNCRDLTLADLLERYKYQPYLERRHEQLKTGLLVTPMWLKSVTRIEPLLFLFFVALLVRALIEREIRLRMKDADLTTLPIYSEDRACPAPTAERILDIFATVQRHDLVDARGHFVQSFEPELTPIQRRVLRLLGMSPALYRRAQL